MKNLDLLRLCRVVSLLKERRRIYSQNDFAEYLGKNKSYVNEIINGKRPFTENFARTICKAFPEVNLDYLLGEDVSEFIATPEVNTLDTRSPFAVRVLPIEAQAGSLQEYAQSVSDNDCEWSASPIKNADFIVPVAGDSMYPEYPNGSRVVVKKIDEKAFIEWGKVYLLDTVNGAIIKQVHECADPDYIKCVSINPHYASFAVRREDIYGMYRVVMLLTLK